MLNPKIKNILCLDLLDPLRHLPLIPRTLMEVIFKLEIKDGLLEMAKSLKREPLVKTPIASASNGSSECIYTYTPNLHLI